MGYASRWTGEVRIEPPLTWGEIKNSRQVPGFQDTKLRLVEDIQDTDTGQIRTVTADAVIPATSNLFNGYDIETELQAAIDAHPSHEFIGTIEARPEDPGGTPWRYVVEGRRVVRQEPVTAWPDEAPVDGRLAAVEALVERARRHGNTTVDVFDLMDALGLSDSQL
ncbi:DUF6205 family protein [Streptomyces sp. NPDC088353]|uniref:DUF6205 family protein n=1 Tax=Streptomyces sp. NPDC088353 TaxID=3365855 RepID=UPI0037F8CA81